MANPKSMPAVATSDQRITPPLVRSSVIARRAQGQAIAHIARELRMSRNTVKAIIKDSQVDQIGAEETIKTIVPIALSTVSDVIKSGDGNLAMRFLENTVLRDTGRGSVTFNDARLNVAIGMLPDARPPLTVGDAHARALPNPEVTSDTPNPASASVAQVGIEAAEKDGRATDTITSHPNFFLTFTFWDGA